MSNVLSDIEIAQQAQMKPIAEVAEAFGVKEDELELYGRYKAKLNDSLENRLKNEKDGKLILVTAINPTPAGEGKTTTTIGVTQAMNLLGKKTIAALREPSLGPCFGIKGGAAGGGYAQVVPMEDLNLHFTGDFHAITSANNLLAALIDNHIMHGNALRIDTKRIIWKRCMDMNDRALRDMVIGLGNRANGQIREDHFIITAASEIMAIFCMATDMEDLKNRLDRIIVAYDLDGDPVRAGDLKATGAMAALLKDAFMPNMIQTLENTPALIHGGPFANIAHGCNSVRATRLALKLADYCVTEAGFGADLGAEKFMDIKCRNAGIRPDAVIIVATVRALKYNGGVPKENVSEPDLEALKKGIVNLDKHIENVQRFGVPVVVALNEFLTDTKEEYEFIRKHCAQKGCEFAISRVWKDGGEGGKELANKVLSVIEKGTDDFRFLYTDALPIEEKIRTIARNIYGADDVEFEGDTLKNIEKITSMGFGKLPVCMAKTQYSLSDDAAKLGRPTGFKIRVRDVYVSAGAGFVVVLTGKILTMPGLPVVPAANDINCDEKTGKISGLF